MTKKDGITGTNQYTGKRPNIVWISHDINPHLGAYFGVWLGAEYVTTPDLDCNLHREGVRFRRSQRSQSVAPHDPHKNAANHIIREGSQFGQSSFRLSLSSTLPLCRRDLPGAGPGLDGRCQRSLCRLPFCRKPGSEWGGILGADPNITELSGLLGKHAQRSSFKWGRDAMCHVPTRVSNSQMLFYSFDKINKSFEKAPGMLIQFSV